MFPVYSVNDLPGCSRRCERRFLDGAAEATLMSRRRASLTALPVGKVLARSGSISTRFVPAVARRKYFPRTPRPRADRSYAGLRSSGPFRACFSELMSLFSRCLSGADDPDTITPVKMGHKNNPSTSRFAKRDVPLLPLRVVGILVGHGQRVQKHRRGLRKGHAMLLEIPGSLA